MTQLPLVNCAYGAPMGRATYGVIKPDSMPRRSIRLFRVKLNSGGYDDGGAYWGVGQALYCATDGDEFRQFTRANSRRDAAIKLELCDWMLVRAA